MSEYFPEWKFFGGGLKFPLDLSNYGTEADLKNATGLDTSKFARKVDLASLESNVDKLVVDKLVPVPVDLSKLSDRVKNYVVKKDIYDAKIKNIEDKIP